MPIICPCCWPICKRLEARRQVNQVFVWWNWMKFPGKFEPMTHFLGGQCYLGRLQFTFFTPQKINSIVSIDNTEVQSSLFLQRIPEAQFLGQVVAWYNGNCWYELIHQWFKIIKPWTPTCGCMWYDSHQQLCENIWNLLLGFSRASFADCPEAWTRMALSFEQRGV